MRAAPTPAAGPDTAVLPEILNELRALKSAFRAAPKRAVAPALTVGELYRLYDEAMSGRHWWTESGRSIMRPTVDAFAKRDVLGLTRGDWRRHLGARTELKRGSPRTLMSKFRAMLSWAAKEGLLTRAQVAEHPWFHRDLMPKAPPPRRSEVSDADLERVLANSAPVFAALVTVMVDTAMRVTSALAIEWGWLDLTEGRLRVPAHAIKNDMPLDIPLSSRAVERLKKLRRRSDSRYVFCSTRCPKPFTKQWAGQRFRKLRDGLGLPAAPGDDALHLHDLRGTSAARVIRAGANLREVMHHLAVKQTATADRYVQRFSEDDRERHRELVEMASRGERVGKDRTR